MHQTHNFHRILWLPFVCVFLMAPAHAKNPRKLPRVTQGKATIEYFDYGDRWTEGQVYLLEHLDGFEPDPKKNKRSRFGGSRSDEFLSTGFFHLITVRTVVPATTRQWLIDPAGHPFLAVGVNQVKIHPRKKAKDLGFKSDRDWAKHTAAILTDNGFNSLCATPGMDPHPLASHKIPYIRNLMLSFTYLVEKHDGDKLAWEAPPYWDQGFIDHVKKRVNDYVWPFKDDPYLIGWITDNEMRWMDDALDRYHLLPNDSTSRQTVEEWVKKNDHARDAEGNFSREAREAFQEFQADQYGKVLCGAIRQVDPNHLIMGARFRRQNLSMPGLMRGFGRHHDAISINYYGAWPPDPVVLDKVVKWSGRPFIVTEFFAQSMETKPTNRRDGWIVRTQEDRGKYYQNSALALLQHPGCIGFQWFRYMDSEEANWGITDYRYKPYPAILAAMKPVNENIYSLVDHLARHPLDYSRVYDPIRNEAKRPDMYPKYVPLK